MLQLHAGKQPAPAAAAVADIMDRTVNTDDPILNREQRYESRIRIRAFLTFARLINSCFFFSGIYHIITNSWHPKAQSSRRWSNKRLSTFRGWPGYETKTYSLAD